MSTHVLKPPFPYFGGKARSAPLVWDRFGSVRSYVEPFFGSGAVLLARPTPFDGVETVNDIDGLICNFWRAVRADPDMVADHADHPVIESDLHARHAWLVGVKNSLAPRLEGDPDWYDARIAGWWCWGMACWIGRDFCSGQGPWQVATIDGVRQLVRLGTASRGVYRTRIHLGDAGQGINRQLVHLGDAGQGVNRKRDNHRDHLFAYFLALSARLRHVRVCCGDWTRVMGDTPMMQRSEEFHPIGVLLDPPYSDAAGRDPRVYRCDDLHVAHAVRDWALAHGDDPRYRIALCGYEGEFTMPTGWSVVVGETGGGYGKLAREGSRNAGRERIWFSPHSLHPERHERPLFALFDAAGGAE